MSGCQTAHDTAHAKRLTKESFLSLQIQEHRSSNVAPKAEAQKKLGGNLRPGPQDFSCSFVKHRTLSLQTVVGPPSNQAPQLRRDGGLETPAKTKLGLSIEKYKAFVIVSRVVCPFLILDRKNP